MEVFEAVRTVLSVREYQEKKIDLDILKKITEAGHLTASSNNFQPWHFILVDDPIIIQKLGELAKTGPYISNAVAAIVVVIERTKFSVSDASRAIQSMILTAWEDGIGSNWVGFNNLEIVKPLLMVPEDRDILAIIPLGYPKEKIGKGKKNRKPFSEIVSKNYFGQNY